MLEFFASYLSSDDDEYDDGENSREISADTVQVDAKVVRNFESESIQLDRKVIENKAAECVNSCAVRFRF